MRQLAVRAADDNLTDRDRSDIQEQVKALLKEMNDRAEKTRYNGHKILSGDITDAIGERLATARVQTNSFLRDGTPLMEIGFGATASNATTYGAVCQGSYEVKLVFNTASTVGQVDAQIFWTDGGGAVQLITTLSDVSGGAKTVYTGGVLITVNDVSRYDTGLVAYAKTLTYVSAMAEDNALQFQTGSDEGEVFRVGIEKMTVDHLFRRDYYRGEGGTNADGSVFDPGFPTPYNVGDGGSISVATTLQAQDLIGQIDDALRIVGRANLKVGAFKNEFDRTLDQQRGNHTQMTGAFVLVNDADMARGATDVTKRTILLQTGMSMVAQANTSSQNILQLLR
jgi:flagellin